VITIDSSKPGNALDARFRGHERSKTTSLPRSPIASASRSRRACHRGA
jgi:hypothetical protein